MFLIVPQRLWLEDMLGRVAVQCQSNYKCLIKNEDVEMKIYVAVGGRPKLCLEYSI